MPDSDSLRLFRAVVRSGSLAGGARTIKISPSLASRRISALEEEIGARLLIRSTRRTQLTEAGAKFLKWADASLVALEDIVAEFGQETTEPVGTVRIAANDYMGSRYLLDAVGQFRSRYPGIELVLSIQDDPITSIRLGYDIAIHAGPTPGETLVGRRIEAYRRVICAAPDYLRSRGVPSSPADLNSHDCLVHSLNDTHRWVFRTTGGLTMTQPINAVVETNSYPMLLDLAVRRLGIIRIADMMAIPAIERGELEEILPLHRSVEADGGDPAVWLTYGERPRLPRVRVIADFLFNQLKTGVRRT